MTVIILQKSDINQQGAVAKQQKLVTASAAKNLFARKYLTRKILRSLRSLAVTNQLIFYAHG